MDPELALDHLLEAATAAAGVATLEAGFPGHQGARRATLEWARPRLGATRSAQFVGVCPRTARRMYAAPVDPVWFRAVGLQMTLRASGHRRAPRAAVPPPP